MQIQKGTEFEGPEEGLGYGGYFALNGSALCYALYGIDFHRIAFLYTSMYQRGFHATSFSCSLFCFQASDLFLTSKFEDEGLLCNNLIT